MPNTAGVTNFADPKERIIAVNGSGGAEVLISASIFTGYVEIQEVPPGSEDSGTYTGGFAPQGLNYQRADENYANTYPLTPGDTIILGDSIQKNRSIGVPSMGQADGNTRPATPFVKVISATVTATSVRVREWRQR